MSEMKLAQSNVLTEITERAPNVVLPSENDEQTALNFCLFLDFADAEQQCFILGYN
ncbi:hypothetical protein RI844_15340 [Thalassotalea fonticola]|uniref:Uncharacterized protein n=1 Tax=Thalassotalea fonticola TaxID=3065649 RepID=A0ABZ0GLF3_9GAMM|nr:hypothetical protein RI844_15340 [Colwelliaceae bacterium S1-1]